MDDLISRQAAIAEFNCCELTPDGGIDANYAIDFLEQLPPVQSRKGKWIGYNADDKDWQRDDDYHVSGGKVIAWMPLPEPWKGEEENAKLD